jgi:hypothetical protein
VQSEAAIQGALPLFIVIARALILRVPVLLCYQEAQEEKRGRGLEYHYHVDG